MKLDVYVGALADDDLVGIARYYRQELQRPEAGRQLVGGIYDALAKLADNRYRRRTSDGLSAKYRRYLVGSYIIFYRVNASAGRLLAYHVRHAARRPLSANTHRRRAAGAERDSHPLHRPTDN